MHPFDEVWRRRALRGEEAALQQFLAAVLQPLYGFCLYRVGRNQHLCEEVVQETLLRALRDLGNYDPVRGNGNVLPWLTGLARNEIQRALQQSKSSADWQALWERMDSELMRVYACLDSEPFNDDLLQREETRELVNATMAQLPDQYRAALEAKYLAGKSMRELAELWQLSEKAVESQLVRARKAFRATFLTLSHNLETGLR
jgi:RNA polymerase sigma-70 factor (ECF subfamily)